MVDDGVGREEDVDVDEEVIVGVENAVEEAHVHDRRLPTMNARRQRRLEVTAEFILQLLSDDTQHQYCLGCSSL